jgi:[ribosomal protein S5]-alanine N-acetyltransferase
MYLIETDRLGFRNWEERDVEEFIRLNKNPKVMEYLPKVLNNRETVSFIQRIKRHFDQNGFGLWVLEIKESQDFIGFLGLSIPTFEEEFTSCVEIGWRLAYEYWGNGYAQEGGKACLKFGFEDLGLDRIVSFTAAINKRSINVMKKIGMKYVKNFNHPDLGVPDRLRDHVLYIKDKDS